MVNSKENKMKVAYTKPNPSNQLGFFELIERFWIVILGLILATPVILRYLKDSQVKNEVNDSQEQIKLNVSQNLSPIKQLEGLNKITLNPFYHKLAFSLAHNLGTIYQSRGGFLSFLNPRTWSENDKEVYNDLKKLTNSGQIKTVVKCYFFITGKNLREDVTRLLDSELLKKLPLFN